MIVLEILLIKKAERIMIKKQAMKEAIEKYKKNDNQRWAFGNKVLYDLCKEHIEHNNDHIIVAKIWLIGRSYAAAIERRKNTDDNADDFYYDVVAPKIIEQGKELDERINTINRYDKPLNEDKIRYIINTHSFLMSIFKDISGQNKRSLASKYLHFHCPDYFFIYDSRAASHIGAYVTKDSDLFNKVINDMKEKDYDVEYCNYFLKSFQITKYAKKECHIDLSPRDIDNIIYYNNPDVI